MQSQEKFKHNRQTIWRWGKDNFEYETSKKDNRFAWEINKDDKLLL